MRVLVGMAVLQAATPLHAQGGMPSIKVEEVRTDSDCSAMASWGPWLAVECREQFPQMRTSLQSALLESNRIRLSTTRAGRESIHPSLIVTASVSGLGQSTSRSAAADYCVAGTRVRAIMDYRVRKSSGGEVVFGGNVSKSVEVASHAVAGAGGCHAYVPSQADYRQLQQELALAVARDIVFKLEPLRVSGLSGQGVVLNYGSPLLKLGMAVEISDSRGVPVRFRVSNAGQDSSIAQPTGARSPIAIDAIARLIEDDDPANNARRFERVELP